jgi:hypothetical protein
MMQGRELPIEPGCLAVVRPGYGSPETVGAVVTVVRKARRGEAAGCTRASTSRAWLVEGSLRYRDSVGVKIYREAVINVAYLRRINGPASDVEDEIVTNNQPTKEIAARADYVKRELAQHCKDLLSN